MLTIYGLKNCDTCRKALKDLQNAGQAATLVDVRETPLAPEQLSAFQAQFGAALLNTRSTTWRGLSEAEQAQNPLDLLTNYPALMKRPVIENDNGALTLGWTAEAKSTYF